MRHPHLLTIENALLLIIDVQEKFREHIHDFSSVLKTIATLVEATKILEIPVVVTEQYPEGLGPTVSEVSMRLGPHKRFCKNVFSCCQQKDFVTYLKSSRRLQVIVTGIECHVCVSQSVLDLLAYGFAPHVVTEAVASRLPENKEVGLKKMVGAGAVISSLETALFELLAQAGDERFKAVQNLIK